MLKFIWYGTNTLKLFDDKSSIIFDPFIRYSKRKDKSFLNNFINEKNILITHPHIDHILDIPYIYKNKNCKIYSLPKTYKRLYKRGLNKQLIKINYNDSISIDGFNIKVYKSKHIKFDFKLILNTLFNKSVLKYFKNFLYLGYNHIKNPLKKEIAAYYINYNNINLFVMGSMNLDEHIKYPTNIDYLILAFQGRSDLDKKVLNILNILEPKKIILTHFDNSFPPISKDVNLDIIRKLNNVIIPEYEKVINIKK